MPTVASPPIERFLPKITIVDSGCWEWVGAFRRGGYGAFWDGKKVISAYRFSYEYFNNTVTPQGLGFDHLCRNPKCVNPDHVEPVTQKVNVMRGLGLPAVNANKTECSKGHSYSLSNTYVDVHGQRHCRVCVRNRNRQYYWRHKQQ